MKSINTINYFNMKNKNEYYSVCLCRYFVTGIASYGIGMLYANGCYTSAILVGVLTLLQVLLYASSHVFETEDHHDKK